jgi:predicted nucleic acid-binding protein
VLYFIESSALVKLFVAELGSQQMVRLVESSEDANRMASSLALVEVRSAIRRRQRGGEIKDVDAIAALGALDSEWRRLIDHPVTSAVIGHSLALIDRRYLRALDALQLASAIAARDSVTKQGTVTFVCSDERLIAAAQSEGFALWNPETP